MKGLFNIALIQTQSSFLSLNDNMDKALRMIRIAANQGAKLVCLPEGFLTGYDCNNVEQLLDYSLTANDEMVQTFIQLAEELNIFLVLPFFEKKDNKYFNSVVLVNNTGEIIGKYSKTHLILGEKEHLTCGNQLPVFETPLGKIGMLICYDLCFPETLRILAKKGAEIVIVPSAWRGNSYYKNWWDLNIACRALDNLLYVAAVNQVGETGNSFFAGKTKVCDPIGTVLSELGDDEESILFTEIDLSKVKEERALNSVLEDLRCDLYLREWE